MALRERIPGGLASGMSPADFDAKELAKGTLHETEHTSDFAVAVEIAMDHLVEDSAYYSKLERAKKRARPGTKASRKKNPKVTTRRRGGSSRRVNQLVRDQFRDIYER